MCYTCGVDVLQPRIAGRSGRSKTVTYIAIIALLLIAVTALSFYVRHLRTEQARYRRLLVQAWDREMGLIKQVDSLTQELRARPTAEHVRNAYFRGQQYAIDAAAAAQGLKVANEMRNNLRTLVGEINRRVK